MKGASMKSLHLSLAILVFLAGVAFAAAPGFHSLGESAAAVPGSVNVVCVVRAPVPPIHLPPTDLQASVDGYIIAVSWTNPAAPYSGTRIEWHTDLAHQGTSSDQSWYEYETYYPPASWARIAAPLGARYSIEGSAYYDGGTTMSVPADTSVVVTSPVDVSSEFPTNGYAASAALSARYGTATYQRKLEARLQVPGGVTNYSMGTNPISWSAQLVGAPVVTVHRLETRPVSLPNPGGTATHYWRLMGTGQGSFADGYPALCSYSLGPASPGVYRLVLQGELRQGFTHRGAQKFAVTRYVTLAPTRFRTVASTPRVSGKPSRRRKATFNGKVGPGRVTTVSVRIQRKIRGRWRPYKTLKAKSKATGVWSVKYAIKKPGLFRVQTIAVASIVDRYHEYSGAGSGWRKFKIR
jgi:hypothetical protein